MLKIVFLTVTYISLSHPDVSTYCTVHEFLQTKVMAFGLYSLLEVNKIDYKIHNS
jgi:hypothetical protein